MFDRAEVVSSRAIVPRNKPSAACQRSIERVVFGDHDFERSDRRLACVPPSEIGFQPEVAAAEDVLVLESAEFDARAIVDDDGLSPLEVHFIVTLSGSADRSGQKQHHQSQACDFHLSGVPFGRFDFSAGGITGGCGGAPSAFSASDFEAKDCPASAPRGNDSRHVSGRYGSRMNPARHHARAQVMRSG
jgi:hypothetical protein